MLHVTFRDCWKNFRFMLRGKRHGGIKRSGGGVVGKQIAQRKKKKKEEREEGVHLCVASPRLNPCSGRKAEQGI